ncbi:MAG: hypothetical protein HY721_21095 [Planctomycetes bacterium]|nr:hypothetical protein [Planctomycetota bacterium]
MFPFVRGDANLDRAVNVSDAVRTLDYLFRGKGETVCPDAYDANDDAVVDLSDAIYTLLFLFGGGAAPPAPYPDCGLEETHEDGVSCWDSACPWVLPRAE